MQISRQQVEDFLAGRLKPDEAEIVAQYLMHVAPEEYDALLGKAEWDLIDIESRLPPETAKRMDQVVLNSRVKKKRVVPVIVKWSVAAAAALITCLFWWGPHKKGTVAVVAQTVDNKAIRPAQDSFVNRADTPVWIDLADGSKVKLFAHSQIISTHGLTGSRREVYLEGKAFFQVAKNKTRPFTVYSAGINTTALGTSFTITAWHNASEVSVELFTGRVVIKAASNRMKDVYLLPGQELVVDRETYRARKTDHHNIALPQKPLQVTRESVIADSIDFEQEPLEKVFNKLQHQFGTKIQYTIKDIKGMSFTGTVTTAQGPEKILTTIAAMNGLKVVPGKDGFLVRSAQ